MCKGADSFIEDRCKHKDPEIHRQVTEYANAGLRTLLFAQREVPLEEYQKWEEKLKEAQISIYDRD